MWPSPVRRRIRLAALAAGMSVGSVLVIAWSSGAFLDYPGASTAWQDRGLSSSEWWSIHREQTFAGVRYISIVMIRANEYKETTKPIEMPSWAKLPQPKTTGSFWTNQHYEIVDGRGWPWPCLSYRFSGTGRGATQAGSVSGGFAFSPFQTGAWYSPRALPYTPIWRGLLGDLAAHFAIWFGLLMLIVEGRRMWRKRHRQCPRCGYSLRGAPHQVCPECGEPVEAQQIAV